MITTAKRQNVGLAKISTVYLILMSVGAANLAAQQSPIRVNVGGSSYTDSKGQVWSADFGFNTGSLSGCAPGATVTGTADPTLFKSARYGPTPPPEMQYSFAVANGNYQVNLYFAETCPGQVVGGRVFDVQMQSATVFSALDIFAAAGGNTALVKSANVTVTNGTLTIQFVHRIDNPIVSAIEIVPLSGTDPAPISVSLAPTSAGVQVNQTQPFTATVQNDAQNKGVAWSLSGTGCSGNACGTLTNVTTTSVTYNAPASAPNPATVGLTATSVADNTKSASTTVTVIQQSPIRVNVGGSSYTDSKGPVWSADFGFNTGSLS